MAAGITVTSVRTLIGLYILYECLRQTEELYQSLTKKDTDIHFGY